MKTLKRYKDGLGGLIEIKLEDDDIRIRMYPNNSDYPGEHVEHFINKKEAAWIGRVLLKFATKDL